MAAAATDVLIFFVGLTMWSEKIPKDCGVKAILPRVVHTSPISTKPAIRREGPSTPQSATAASRAVAAVPHRDSPHVQNHAAAIVFHSESFVSQYGWGQPRILPSGSQAPGTGEQTQPVEVFWYIPLDGDHVRFVTNGASNDPASLKDVKLPQLQQELCPARPTLAAAYQPPYRGAAAVIALPEGTLQACLNVPPDSDGRLDTRLDMKTIGNLVISASTMRDTKELRLKPRRAGGPIEVMIANVPEAYYRGIQTTPLPTAIDGMSHENVYHAMSEPSNGNCTLSLNEWWNESERDGIPLCNAGTLAFEPGAPIISTSLSTSGANFACSNTAWP